MISHSVEFSFIIFIFVSLFFCNFVYSSFHSTFIPFEKNCYSPPNDDNGSSMGMGKSDIGNIQVQFSKKRLLNNFYSINNGCNPGKLYVITTNVTRFKPSLLSDLHNYLNDGIAASLLTKNQSINNEKSIDMCKLAFWTAILKHDDSKDQINARKMIPMITKLIIHALERNHYELSLCYLKAPLIHYSTESRKLSSMKISKELVKRLQKTQIDMRPIKRELKKQYYLTEIYIKLLEYRDKKKIEEKKGKEKEKRKLYNKYVRTINRNIK